MESKNGGIMEEDNMTLCNKCDDKITDKSYFLSVNKGMAQTIMEVCPECHHFFVYGTPEQLENYKKRRNIK